jgi:DNA-binding MarR family transcriptional regulator
VDGVTHPATKIEAARAVVRLSRLLERATGDLGLPHYRVLSSVAAGDERASRVAMRLALAKPTVSASVDALCNRGLLVREDDCDDQRATALRLTPSGTSLLAEIEAAMLARLDKVLCHSDDARTALTALAGLGSALDDLAGEHAAARCAARKATR